MNRRPRPRSIQQLFLSLESRLLMCGDHAVVADKLGAKLGTYPGLFGPVLPASPVSGPVSAPASGGPYSLSQVPALNSKPGATARLFLDFNGAPAQTWGSFSVPATPAYDTDGNTSNFSKSEVDSIADVWARVAEKFSSFNINITTVDPGSAAGVQKVVIGGNGAWLGQSAGGVSYVGTFSMTGTSTSWVFPANLGNGFSKYVAEASSHESGHAFNLQHQSTYSGTTKTNEYNPGNSLVAPVMGNSYSAARGLWFLGTSATSSTTIQDDMAVLSSTRNGFGYTADEHSNTTTGATPLTVSGTGWVGAGLIGRTSDIDVYSFTTAGGQVNFTAYTAATGATLDAKLSLLDSTGATVVTSATSSLSESLSANLPAGTYYISVASQGSYGDVGQYRVEGNVGSAGDLIAAPSSLWAVSLGGGAVDLAWKDNASNESQFTLERSIDGGGSWSLVANVAAGSTSYQDVTSFSAGASALYRITATSTGGVVSPSWGSAAVAIPATAVPTTPSGLTVASVTYNRVNLTWTDVPDETGYRVERSTDQNTWAAVGTTGQNVTTFADSTVAQNTTYYYRLVATNGAGDSGASALVTAVTPTLAVPADPSNLTARATSRSKIALTWVDNASNETGFKIERSLNGTSGWTQIGTVGANVTTYTAAGLSRSTNYFFRVRATNAAGDSGYSNVASTATPARSTAVFSTTPAFGSANGNGGKDSELDELLED